jgi:hypothetical protein
MENIRQKHRRLYTNTQFAKLLLLVEVLNDQPVFICDVDPDIDFLSPYYKAEDYPVWGGGQDNFLIGIEKVKRFWLVPFWKYTTISLFGELRWKFKADTFTSVDLVIYKPIMTCNEKQKKDEVAYVLQCTFKCPVNSYHSHFSEIVAGIKAAQA